MSDTLSKIEKRTAYILILPAVFLVFSIILFPIFANVWISFKEVGLKDIRIPEPRAKKIVKSIEENPDQAKIIYKLRNSSLILEIREVKFKDKLPKNIKPVNLDERCRFKSNKIYCEFGNWQAKYRENFEIILLVFFLGFLHVLHNHRKHLHDKMVLNLVLNHVFLFYLQPVV